MAHVQCTKKKWLFLFDVIQNFVHIAMRKKDTSSQKTVNLFPGDFLNSFNKDIIYLLATKLFYQFVIIYAFVTRASNIPWINNIFFSLFITRIFYFKFLQVFFNFSFHHKGLSKSLEKSYCYALYYSGPSEGLKPAI